MSRTVSAPPPARAPLRSARQKIRAVIRSTLVAVGVLLVTGVGSLLLVYQQLELVAQTLSPSEAAATTVLEGMVNAETGIRGYRLTGNPAFLRPYQAALAPLAAGQADLDRLLGRDAELAPVVREQQATIQRWLTAYAEPAAATPGPRPVDARAEAAAKDVFDHFREVNDRLTRVLVERRAQAQRRSTQVVDLGVLALLATAVAAASVGLRPAFRAMGSIAPPLEALEATVRRLEAGELDARADPSRGVTEIRAFSRAFNLLAETSQRQQERMAEELRLGAMIRDISHRVGDTLDLGAVVDGSVSPLQEGFRTNSVWVRAFEGEGELPGRGRGAVRPPLDGLVAPASLISAGIDLGRATWEREASLLLTADGTADPADVVDPTTAREIMDYVGRVGTTALLFAPLGAGGEALGYLGLGRAAGQPAWSGAEREAAVQLGRDIGRAVLHARLYEREQAVVEGLKALDSKKDAFVSMVSHELRTPLASIIGHLEVVRSGDLGDIPASADRSPAAIDRNSTRLTSLIEDLLLLSKIEEGAQPLTVETLDLADVIVETITGLELYARRHSVHVSVEVDTPSLVRGEPHELERVVSNLVTNAVKFSPAGSEVEVRLAVEDGDAVLRVRDRGLGISPADQEQLFTRFFRSTNRAAQEVPGTGLGLAIVKIIMERHRGSVQVGSTLGEGSTFTVRVPLFTGTAAELGVPLPGPWAAGGPGGTGGPVGTPAPRDLAARRLLP